MSQIFRPSSNTIAKATILGGLLLVGAIVASLYAFALSGYSRNTEVVVEQPVQFSHEHHVSGLGIDCRYCHTSVETSAFAGIPPVETCMTCHSQVWADAPYLEPVRESYETGEPIAWNRVHNLGDFVYFNHSIHLAKGVGCQTCHGQVDQMALMQQEAPLSMSWCLNCHRDPAQYLRPREEVFNMQWTPPADQAEQGARLMQEYRVGEHQDLKDCSICHR